MTPNVFTLPFESVRKAAQTFVDPQVKSCLQGLLVQSQLETGQFDAALKTLTTISPPKDRRTALSFVDISLVPLEKIEPFVQLMQSDKETEWQIGYCAITLLESKNTPSAWKWIETAQKPFETEHTRYLFIKNVLPLIKENDWGRVLCLHRRFTDPLYKDWATLEMIKFLTRQQRYEEADTFARSFALPTRRSWAFAEMSRLTDAAQSAKFLDSAIEEINVANVDSSKTETEQEREAENLAIQLRILGRLTLQQGHQESGEQLLERCESIIAGIKMPMQRYKQQCFLGKVLIEWNLISSIQDFVPVETILSAFSSGTDRAKVLVWLAEAGWNEGWQRAVEALSLSERGVMESERAAEIVFVVNRCVSHHRGSKTPPGALDMHGYHSSGEEWETLSFTPFADPDCNC